MNKPLLTIGIILSLGTFGCAGFGVQQSYSLTSAFGADRGVDALWDESPQTPHPSVDAPRYADQALGTLWDEAESIQSGLAEVRADQEREADLWNSAWY